MGEIKITEQELAEKGYRLKRTIRERIGERVLGSYHATKKEYVNAFKRVQEAYPEKSLPRWVMNRTEIVARAGATLAGIKAQTVDWAWGVAKMAIFAVNPIGGILAHLVPGKIFSAPERMSVRAGSKVHEFMVRTMTGNRKKEDVIVGGMKKGWST